ncbi:glycosyltransferase family 1 protein [Thalassotalea euphylliae]|uniref:Glycosyltransferase family 1 protein n=1 Tax=Thalassotalea euphylliae TaxID=1655234 RepID=A0A3E0TPY6_9GAMM|nr:glycosyltransferase family 4 protein [Thalassotalea euphylliae]REL26122.1 glycosyltransferase family 1 protein [Thalassotalea euphylliae]
MKKVVVVGTAPGVGKGGISSALVGYIKGLEENQVPYEFIESHNSEKNILLLWWVAFWRVALLSIRYRRDAVFWFHGAQWLSTLRKSTLAVIPRLFGSTTLFHVHSPAFHDYLSKGKLNSLATKVSLLPYSKLVVLTPWWASFIKQCGINKPTIVSANPNDPVYCQQAASFVQNEENIKGKNDLITIISMARLVEGKGVDLVIKAMSQLPERVRLVIAGEGEQAENYQLLAHELGLEDRVTFKGWISGQQKEDMLNSADLLCLPSRYDSFGMVFIEAMAFNLPVVAYNWGPIGDVVTPDVGECCTEATSSDVARCITKVIGNFEHYHGNGPRKVINFYTPKAVVANIMDEFTDKN